MTTFIGKWCDADLRIVPSLPAVTGRATYSFSYRPILSHLPGTDALAGPARLAPQPPREQPFLFRILPAFRTAVAESQPEQEGRGRCGRACKQPPATDW